MARGRTDAKQVGKQNHRAGRAYWLVLAMLPLIAWLVLAAQAALYRQPATANPDLLLDRLLDRLGQYLVEHQADWDGYMEVKLPDRELATWEDEFGGDPRYWMLRHYYATDVPPEYTAHVPGAGFNLNVYFLREAQRRGLADPAIIKELYKTYEWRLLKLARQDVGPAPPSYSTLPERNLYYWRYIDEHYGAEFEEIRTELLAVAGDYSWPYYRLAMVESEHCNNEAAWELIRRGNRAPLNQVTHCFPFNEIIGQFWDGQPLTDRITGGMAYQEVVYPWLTDPVRTKDMVIRLTADAREREDLAALGELHLYCCRFGSMERASLLQGLNGLVMAKNIVLDAAQNQWPVPHTAEQRQALARLHQKFLNINQTCRALSHQTGVPPGPAVPTSRARQWIDKWANVLGGRLGVAVEYYGWLHDDGLIEYHGMCSQIAPLFAEAEQFDYATLSWPDE